MNNAESSNSGGTTNFVSVKQFLTHLTLSDGESFRDHQHNVHKNEKLSGSNKFMCYLISNVIKILIHMPVLIHFKNIVAKSIY